MKRAALLPALLAALVALGCNRDARPPALGQALSVEQPGGGATQLLAASSQLPVSATESFTTGKDSERKIFVHVLRGAGKKAGDLDSGGWWQIDGISDAPAGHPRVMVTFEFDGRGELSVSAREEDRKLKVSRSEGKGARPAALTEPDEDDEGVDDE